MADTPYVIDNDPFFQYLNGTSSGDVFGRTQYGQLASMLGQDNLDALIKGWSGYNGWYNQPPPVAPAAPPRPPPQVNIPPAGGIFPGSIRGNNMYSNPQQFQPMQRQQMQFGNRGFAPVQQPTMPTFNPASVGGIFNVSPTAPWMSGAPQGR